MTIQCMRYLGRRLNSTFCIPSTTTLLTRKRKTFATPFLSIQKGFIVDNYLRRGLAEALFCQYHTMDPGSPGVPAFPPENVVDLTEDIEPSDSSEDPDLKAAISLSLEQENESDDEELKAAIALSLQSSTHSTQDPPTSVALAEGPTRETFEKDELSKATYGIPGLDRRADEEARLRRLKRKREASISPPTPGRNSITSTNGPLDQGLVGSSKTSKAPQIPLESTMPRKTSDSGLQYPDGVIKKTWAFGYSRSDDIKIEELLQREALQAAVLSSFQWNMEWLFSKLDTHRTKFVLVMQAESRELQEQYRSETASMKNLRLCFPPMDGQVFCMHSKLMLLFYENRLRIVVPTANLTDYDWGEMGGVMENSCFIIDLPKLLANVPGSNVSTTTSFQASLMYFLEAQNMQKDVVEKIKLFDFQKTARLGFVHSIGGAHADENWRKTGLSGLGATLQQLGLQTEVPISVDYIASSIGSLNDNFLRSMYLAAQGDDGLTAMQLANRISKNSGIIPSRQVTRGTGEGWRENMRIYYPSTQTVRSSKGGPNCAGTICFPRKWYNSQFPKDVMRDSVSSRPGLLMHNKV